MSISDSLAALRGVRDAIRDAIVSKGGSLPSGSPMGVYATAITNLPSGSGGDTEIPFRSRLTVPGDTAPWHLTSLTATSIDTYAFRDDKLLTTVSLPAATSIDTYAFQSCSALTTVSLPAVTSIDTYAFQSCSALTTVSLPAATSIASSAFQSCSALTTVSLPAVTSIGSYAFQSCTSLTTADFPLVTSISTSAFQSCSALTTVSLPAVTSIGTGAFRYCTALTSLTLTKMATLSNTNVLISTPIESGTGYVYVPDDLVDQYKAATNWATYANQILPLSQKP